MSAAEVDGYLAGLDGTSRETLQEMRRRILRAIPNAEQCLRYGAPAFRIGGKTVAGLAASKSHLSYLPHSGTVLSALAERTASYRQSLGSLHFAVDTPLPQDLVDALVEQRLRELGGR